MFAENLELLFSQATIGTCISKPHLVLDDLRAIGIATRINIPIRKVIGAKRK
jgi:hypothetical protein